jgi:hypothetical protein
MTPPQPNCLDFEHSVPNYFETRKYIGTLSQTDPYLNMK